MFILLSLGLILFTIVCLLNLRPGALLIILCLPLYLILFNIFWIPTNVLDVLIFILFICWIRSFVIARRVFPTSCHCEEGTPDVAIWIRDCHASPAGSARNDKQIGNSVIRNWKLKIIPPISLILSGCFFSALLNDNKLKSLGIVKSWFVAPIIFFVILISQFRSEKQRELILSVLAVSGAGVAAVSLIYKILGIVTYDGRLQGVFNSPNYLAMYLAPCILICGYKIAKVYESHSEATKNPENLYNNEILCWPPRMTAYFLSLLVVFAAFYYTFSYSAWISLFLAGVVFFALYIRKIGISKKLSFLFYGGFIVILALGLFTQLKSPKMANLVHSKRNSIESRLMIWRSARLILKENPVFGIGLGNFQDEYLALEGQFEKPYLQWAVPHPHNIFLAFWLGCGLFGLIGFIWLLAAAIKKGLALMRTNPSDCHSCEGRNLIGILLFSILIYILLHGLVDTTYFKNDLSVVFWIVIFLLS